MSFRQAVTIKRVDAAPVATDGIYAPAATSNFTIKASIQPLKPNEMQLLEEGRRDSEAFRLYTDTQLLTAKTSTKKNADIAVFYGNEYEVLSCATWQNNVINHYKAIVVKL